MTTHNMLLNYRVSFFGFLILFSGFANADYKTDLAMLKKGMPATVKSFIDRQIGCNHWIGEEPYDKDRAKEIADAVEKLKCNALEKDESRLKTAYKLRPSVIKAINKAKAFY